MKEKRPNDSKKLGDKLKSLRDKRGWSQGQVAKKVSADPHRISKYERGVIFPTVDMLIKLAKAFGVTLDDLLLDNRDINIDQISNPELTRRFNKISQLSEEDQQALIVMMDALIKKQQLETILQNDV